MHVLHEGVPPPRLRPWCAGRARVAMWCPLPQRARASPRLPAIPECCTTRERWPRCWAAEPRATLMAAAVATFSALRAARGLRNCASYSLRRPTRGARGPCRRSSANASVSASFARPTGTLASPRSLPQFCTGVCSASSNRPLPRGQHGADATTASALHKKARLARIARGPLIAPPPSNLPRALSSLAPAPSRRSQGLDREGLR